MVIDLEKNNKKVMRAILRGHNPTDIMTMLVEQYANQIKRIQRNCKHRASTGEVCQKCLKLIRIYEYSSHSLTQLSQDVKMSEDLLKNKK